MYIEEKIKDETIPQNLNYKSTDFVLLYGQKAP